MSKVAAQGVVSKSVFLLHSAALSDTSGRGRMMPSRRTQTILVAIAGRYGLVADRE